jgi:hypothetical protein
MFFKKKASFTITVDEKGEIKIKFKWPNERTISLFADVIVYLNRGVLSNEIAKEIRLLDKPGCDIIAAELEKIPPNKKNVGEKGKPVVPASKVVSYTMKRAYG